MEGSPLLSSTYLSRLAYLGGCFPSGAQSARSTHSMREEPRHASVCCCSPAKRKPDSKDGTAGRAPAQTGQAGLSPSGSRGGVSPVLSAVAGRGKCGRSIKPTPHGYAHTPVHPAACPSHCRPAFSHLPTSLWSKHPKPVTYLTSRGSAPALSRECPGWWLQDLRVK